MKKAMNVLGFPITRTMTENLMEEAEAQVRHKKKFKVTTNSSITPTSPTQAITAICLRSAWITRYKFFKLLGRHELIYPL